MQDLPLSPPLRDSLVESRAEPHGFSLGLVISVAAVQSSFCPSSVYSFLGRSMQYVARVANKSIHSKLQKHLHPPSTYAPCRLRLDATRAKTTDYAAASSWFTSLFSFSLWLCLGGVHLCVSELTTTWCGDIRASCFFACTRAQQFM